MIKRKKIIVTAIVLIIALFSACYDDENNFIAEIHDKTVEITYYVGTKTNINIPQRIQKLPVTAIGKRAFAGKKLTGVKIPNGVTVIDNFAFYENHLSKIIIPDTVVSIGDAAFAYNELTSVKIPDTVTGIGAAVFA
ncbi:MAG: leucine-rich repeat domain-containing protein, partial [Treponema sp.]|nr:leucine-rich repeat domain-containing protein [Treponema sp.]